ncbi:MAG: macro domain-containing protein [Clostridia bacterium]|nr:macro domain-containing protein [Clostridia bacterium]
MMQLGVEQIENYCHFRWQKEMNVNEIRITTGFALLKDIIHIYAPIYNQEKEPLNKLKESYLTLFEVVRKEKYSKVIIPSIATGFHCYRHEDVAELVINLLEIFCSNNEDIDIIFNLYDEKTKCIYEQYL